MADNITIIRLEVSGTASKEQSSANSANISPGTLVATAGIKGSLFDKIGTNTSPEIVENVLFPKYGAKVNSGFIGATKGYFTSIKARNSYFKAAKLMEEQKIPNLETNETYLDNILGGGTHADAATRNLNEAKAAAIRNTKKYGPKMATATLAAYSIYSQYQSVGYNLSGASHAAQVQQRTTQGATFAAGLGLSIATGQYWATATMLAGRAWQLSQQNRQEIYQIRSSQIISQVMQERLVKDTIQRRF